MLKKVARPSSEIINWEDFFSQKLLNLVKKLQMQPKVYQEKTYLWIGITVWPGSRNWLYTTGGALSFSGMVQSYISQAL